MEDEIVKRLDLALVSRGLVESREKARALILAGEVLVNGKKIDKAGTKVTPTAEIEIKEGIPFVSRGGFKLLHALESFKVEVKGRVTLDAGASTGGFTDCLLQRGARSVIAVDVGYGQFAWKLRQDPRVTLMEKTNIRYLTADQLQDLPSLIVADLSFISLRRVLSVLKGLLVEDGEIIALIKPQFEAGREKVGKKGVIRDRRTHQEVLYSSILAGKEEGLGLRGLTYSPLLGPKGNIEFLIYWRKGSLDQVSPDLEKLVAEAWESLNPPFSSKETKKRSLRQEAEARKKEG